MQDLVWFRTMLTGESVSFSPDGQFLATTGGFGAIFIYRVSDGSIVRTLTGHTDWVNSVTFSPNGQILASGSWDNTIKLWRVSDGSLIRTSTGHTDLVTSVTFSPDGQFLASGALDGVALWRGVNRPPSTPTLLLPSDKPLFPPHRLLKLSPMTLMETKFKFEIQVTKGSETKTFTTGFIASGSEATYNVPSDQSFSEGQWSWRAKAIG